MARVFFLVSGWICFGLGIIGVVLPVLPTTPFMILAAFLFARGSPRARKWLIEGTRFGPHITLWENQGAIAPAAKKLAIGVMALVFVVSVVLQAPIWVLIVQAACMGPAAIFIWTRPSPTAVNDPD